MSQENKPQHTPGTALRDGRTVYVLNADGVNRFFAPAQGGFTDTADFTKEEELQANARLLCASYNAFDAAARRLGVNAVEMAESMADGGLADIIEALRQLEIQSAEVDLKDHHLKTAIVNARAALAKVIHDRK